MPVATLVDKSTVDGMRCPAVYQGDAARGALRVVHGRVIGNDRHGDRAWFGTKKQRVRLARSRRMYLRSGWNAHLALNQEVTGSSPARSTLDTRRNVRCHDMPR